MSGDGPGEAHKTRCVAAVEATVAQLNDALRRCSPDQTGPRRTAIGSSEATMNSALDRAKNCAKELAGNVEVALTIARARIQVGASR